MNESGNKILITGAGTGMGLAAAKIFHQEGNSVVMVARNEDRLKKEAGKLGKGATYIACDLTKKDQLNRLIEDLKENHSDLNMAFLNAGIAHHYLLLDKSGDDAYVLSLNEMMTNYHSTVFLTHELRKILENKEEAALIITTSGVAFAPDLLHPTYSATKAAMHSYILGLRLVLERKKSPIKLFELMAPLVDTPFSEAVESDAKLTPGEVIETMVQAMNNDQFEIRPGITEDIYQASRSSHQEGLLLVNNATGF